MSKPSPTLLNRRRFFLRFHSYISTTSTPHTHTHRPHPLPAQATIPQLHPPSRPPSKHPTRPASTSSTRPPAPAKTLPHYALFPNTLPHGPPPHGPFAIDTRQLRQEYLRLQSRAHPDLHQNNAADRARFEGLSALINDAYRTLQSPLLRAQYLLSQRGVDPAEDEGAKVEDAGLLTEVLEVREAMEGAGRESELEGLRRGNEARVAESEGVLGEAFARDDVEGAKAEAVRLRYWTNIKEALDAWERGKPVVLVH